MLSSWPYEVIAYEIYVVIEHLAPRTGQDKSRGHHQQQQSIGAEVCTLPIRFVSFIL